MIDANHLEFGNGDIGIHMSDTSDVALLVFRNLEHPLPVGNMVDGSESKDVELLDSDLGDYRKALDCNQKVHMISLYRTAPVRSLALANRDLGNCEESLIWFDAYDIMVNDHHLDNAYMMANAALGENVETKELPKL